jgi:predicted metal-dependent hydrolase
MAQMTINNLEVDVVRKDIKNAHIGVYPPQGRIRIAIPHHIGDEAVRLMVISKLTWIRKQQQKFQSQQRQTEREYVSGESHYFEGRRYLLEVVYEDVPPRVRIKNNNKLELQVRPGSDQAKKRAVITAWYRQHLKTEISPLVEKWESRIGVNLAEWRVKQMKTKWGSCNIEARRIWLNLELAKKPLECLEYIIVHEMVHLLERHHNERFRRYMDQFLPNWRQTRDMLNREPLAYETWDY